MEFWQHVGPVDLLIVAALLVVARLLVTGLPLIRKMALPAAIVAGVLGLVGGPGVLDLLPLDTASLETVVYHCLGLLYISMALQAAPKGKRTLGAGSITWGVPFIILVQGVVGLLFVLVWGAFAGPLHPGFGLMLALGFSQGPGQALALGTSWEAAGFEHGGQAGLLMAALGFAWCSVVGVGLYHVGRRLGWHKDGGVGLVVSEDGPASAGPDGAVPGDLDLLTRQIALVGLVYLGVWGLISAVGLALPDKPALVERLWGFHFIVALGLALLVRVLLERLGQRDRMVDDAVQTRISGFIIDLAAVCALAAVRVDLLVGLILPALLLSTLGGLISTGLLVWLARRVFPERPFAHLLVLFGTATGTLPTGLVLLRLEDPELRSPAARNIVMGMPGAMLISIPLIVAVIPLPVNGWPDSYPSAVWLTAGICMLYGVGVLVAWRFVGAFRGLGSPLSPWPRGPHPLQVHGGDGEPPPR